MRSVFLATAVSIFAFQFVDGVKGQTDSATPKFASVAGTQAETLCKALASKFQPPAGMTINGTFSNYFPEGSMPSLEYLTQLYPAGTIPKGTDVQAILDSVGPDIDIKSDSGYAKANTRASTHGPTGSMPAFCRFGAFIKTSELTVALSEVWMPLCSDPSIPLAPVNATDFPTNTTAFQIAADSKSFDVQPLYAQQGQVMKIKPAEGSSDPPAPNDVPASASSSKTNDKSSTPAKDTTAAPYADRPSTVNMLQRMIRRLGARRTLSRTKLEGDAVIGHGDGWNGRLALLGNGAQRGFVPLRDLKQMVARYNFAVAGTNLGHFSAANGVTWVNGTQFEDTLLDFASRANHLTLQLAEAVLDAFYGPTAGVRVPAEKNRVRRYYLGSSVGAARGLSAAQVYPDDFHGIIIGPPANNFMNMNTGQIHTCSVHNKTVAGKGWFTQNALYGPMKDVVTRQCDALDGVKDGIISNPFQCKPNFDEMLCGTQTKYGMSNGTCLTQVQIDNALNLYKPTIIDGQTVYPAYLPGLEDSASSMTASNSKSSGWHQLVVLRQPALNSSFNQFTDIRFSDLQSGNAADPGGVNAVKTDLSAFIKKGGKMIMYHGTYDLVVSPQATINYYEAVLRDTPGAADAFKFFLVPGMRHSRGGPGAWHFGGPTQADPGNRPLTYNTGYDVILAMLAWVEKDLAVDTIISARYNKREAVLPIANTGKSTSGPVIDLPLPDLQQNYNWGLVETRKLCSWPKTARYQSGPTTGEHGYKAFACV